MPQYMYLQASQKCDQVGPGTISAVNDGCQPPLLRFLTEIRKNSCTKQKILDVFNEDKVYDARLGIRFVKLAELIHILWLYL
ncbi:hypothetical protein DPMN_189447 [Dreissena polymorpha]|uniref:Uncharacterized protein n=1 Tax=Dreissena polymorpha TaxID=45954 RepID=A0A9D4I9H6_DREPO|nr:hypothetical protein DPMN_189447 [Dreissena polymorpha]